MKRSVYALAVLAAILVAVAGCGPKPAPATSNAGAASPAVPATPPVAPEPPAPAVAQPAPTVAANEPVAAGQPERPAEAKPPAEEKPAAATKTSEPKPAPSAPKPATPDSKPAAPAKPAATPSAPAASNQTVVIGTIEVVSNIPDPSTLPYDTCVVFIKYKVTKVVSGTYDGDELLAAFWGLQKGKLQPAARFKVGESHRMTIEPLADHKDLERVMQADDTNAYSLTPYWVVSCTKA